MASFTDSFTQHGGDAVPEAGPSHPFGDDGYLGYDPRLHSQQFESFTATHFADSDSVKDLATDSTIFHENKNYNSFSPGDDVFVSQSTSDMYAEENGTGSNGSFAGSDSPILPPPAEMEHEEGFALREWRRQNAIRLEEKEKIEKELLSQIIDEAEEYKVDFYRRRTISCENNKGTNREKEKLFLAKLEKFHAEVDNSYWKSIAELIHNEVPTIEKKRGKKDQDKKPSIAVVQGPKPGKPTDLSRMRQIILKLKHNTPPHLKPSPPAPAPAKDAKTSGASVSAAPPKATVVVTPEAVVAALIVSCCIMPAFEPLYVSLLEVTLLDCVKLRPLNIITWVYLMVRIVILCFFYLMYKLMSIRQVYDLEFMIPFYFLVSSPLLIIFKIGTWANHVMILLTPFTLDMFLAPLALLPCCHYLKYSPT